MNKQTNSPTSTIMQAWCERAASRLIRYAHAHNSTYCGRGGLFSARADVTRKQEVRGRSRVECSYNSDLRPSLSLLWESVELEKYRGSGPEETIWCPMCYLAVFSARLAALLCFIFSVRYAYIQPAQDSRKYKS